MPFITKNASFHSLQDACIDSSRNAPLALMAKRLLTFIWRNASLYSLRNSPLAFLVTTTRLVQFMATARLLTFMASKRLLTIMAPPHLLACMVTTTTRPVYVCRRGDAGKMAVVVSAMGGKPKVTDLLLNSVSLAAAGNKAGSEVGFGPLWPLFGPQFH